MRRVLATMWAPLFFALLFAPSAVAAPAQPACGSPNAAKSEGKFTGQISNKPDGSSMEVTYGDQTVLVHYNSSVSVCEGGQPASVSALTRGASVSVFGLARRNGKNMEIDAARIFVTGRPQAAKPNSEPAQANPRQTQPSTPDQQAPLRSSSQQAPLPTSGQQPPLRMTGQGLRNSVILRGGTHAETMQRLRVVRKYALADLRATPQMTLGEGRLDFRPMLNNPKALFNIGPRLHALSQHVDVREDSSEISEVDEGLVIHHVLSYRILPGKCSDPDAKAQLSRAGVECFTRAPVNQRMAEFSRPGSPRYVADPGKRQEAIAAFQRNSAQAEADSNKHIADLRKALADPTQRAAIAAQVGQAETARMSTLSDDQLKEEMINSSVQRFEETLFVPKIESAHYAHLQHVLKIAASNEEMAAAQQLLREGVPEHGVSPANFPKLLKIVPAHSLAPSAAPGGDKTVETDMGPYYFLTGFTMSHDYEWRWGVGVTINWCLVGCSATYGLDLYAGFNYAFGLRFLVQTQLKYHLLVHPNNSAEAKVTTTFQPIQGNISEFFEAGLPGEQMFNAKELVAQVGADAGFNLSLPGVNVGKDFPVGVDFTQFLPGPFANGFFTPPAPGEHGPDGQFFFDQIDLLGELLNFGVAGGRLSPAVDLNLHSNKLQFTLNDEIPKRQTRINSKDTVQLTVGPSSIGNESHFNLGNPVYNLGFTVTPGLNPNVWVDIDVWSNTWNFPIWFPQLAVDLPPHGIDFGCHADTTCVMDFAEVYNASTGQVANMSKEADAAYKTLTHDGRGTHDGACELLGARSPGEPGKYLCPIKGGMLGLCQAMLKTGSAASCGVFVPPQVDKALRYKNYCTGDNGAYVCQKDMMALCNTYLKNQEILSCKAK